MPRVYLDVCCYDRPLDNQRVERNRLESEAVLSILERVRDGTLELVSSDAVDDEIDANAFEEKRMYAAAYASLAMIRVEVGEPQMLRGRSLAAAGFGSYDALHVACAETAGCDALLTTDGQFLRLAARSALAVRVENPWDWIKEQVDHARDRDD